MRPKDIFIAPYTLSERRVINVFSDNPIAAQDEFSAHPDIVYYDTDNDRLYSHHKCLIEDCDCLGGIVGEGDKSPSNAIPTGALEFSNDLSGWRELEAYLSSQVGTINESYTKWLNEH